MTIRAAVAEFMRLYREAGGASNEPIDAVRELFAAYEQAQVFAEELHETFAEERARAGVLQSTLEELRASHEVIERSEERFRALVSNTSDAVVIVDGDGRVTYGSPATRRVWGWSDREFTGSPLTEHVHPRDASKLEVALMAANEQRGHPLTTNFRVLAEDASIRFIEAVVVDLRDEPSIAGFVLNARNVTERVLLQEELQHAASRDPLTGLPNRALFTSHLEQSLGGSSGTSAVSLLLVDIDRFKVVNESLGHAAGDAALVEVAHQLQAAAPSGSFIGRLGGDEFAVLVRGRESSEADRFASEFVAAASKLDGPILPVSIGLATCNEDIRTAAEMFRGAGLALFQAKHEGGGRHVAFDATVDAGWIERLQLEADLRLAVAGGQMRLLYQPIVEMTTGRVAALEALVRWEHPRHGTISPTQFIPIAEESGLIIEIGGWVLREGCRQLAAWHAELREETADGGLEYLSLNASAAELRDPEYVTRLEGILHDAGVDPGAVQIEITESLLMDDGADPMRMLAPLRALGVRLAIDDFGTGYSSLSYLTRMPVDMMKIDRSFVDGMLSSDRVDSVVRATISLASALDLGVVAEGVETVAQRTRLEALGCTLGQGYLWARPLPAAEVLALIRSGAHAVEEAA